MKISIKRKCGGTLDTRWMQKKKKIIETSFAKDERIAVHNSCIFIEFSLEWKVYNVDINSPGWWWNNWLSFKNIFSVYVIYDEWNIQ